MLSQPARQKMISETATLTTITPMFTNVILESVSSQQKMNKTLLGGQYGYSCWLEEIFKLHS